MIRHASFGLAMLAVGAVVGCSAAPGEEASGSAESAITRLPEATCEWQDAGFDSIGTGPITLKVGGSYTGTDPQILAFQRQILQIGRGSYTASQVQGGMIATWYAVDVTYSSPSAVTSLVNQYKAKPVYAGYYACSYDWSDYYIPPGGTRPYVPTFIAVYDPRGCTSCE